MPSIRSAVVALAIASSLALAAAPAAAHDQWLEAEPFFSTTPGREKLYLYTGERFADAQPLVVKTRDRFTRFFIVSSAGRRDVLPDVREDVQPILLLTSGRAAGSFLIATDTVPYTIELDSKKFANYLLDERLVHVLAARVAAGAEDLPGRERYTRHLKTIVQIGQRLDPLVTQPVGQDLEIVPEAHPYGVAPGGQLVVKVLFKGKPLLRQAVTAVNRYRGEIQSKTWRTDENGRVAFAISRAGDWMIRLVHMEPSDQKDVDWRSYWANLTFALPETALPRATPNPPASR